MLNLNEQHRSVLHCYSRPIVHLRKQVAASRFGLVFGAGLSGGFGIPTWGTLVEAIANDPEVQGTAVLQMAPPRAGLPYQTEMLFEHFKRRSYATAQITEHHTRHLDFRIGAQWREMVRRHLYSAADAPLGQSLDSHPYFKQCLPLIQRSHMTVTYNFDDFIEQALLSSRSDADKTSRGFESVTDPWTQFRRPTAIIYHPNGLLPQNPLEALSDRFVFSEASYAEQLMGIFAGDQAGLLNHFSKHTCLLLGLSLEDETLRSVLMQGARSSPGNYHYYVHHLLPGEFLDDEKRLAVTLANFKVYNLITLFLDDTAIRAVLQLLDTQNVPTDSFCDFASVHDIPVRFRFYVVGPLGVGKSTSISYFRNLLVLDEWLEERPPILAKDWEQLTPTELASADQWIAEQFARKNEVLRNDREGVFVLDRGPLDPLSFTPEVDWNAKANQLLKAMCPGKASWRVEDGRVIFLEGDPPELALRMVLTHREGYTAEKLKQMEAQLRKAYGAEGITAVDTRGLTPGDVARRMSEIIHLDPYGPTCDLHSRLEAFVEHGVSAAK